MNCSAKQPAAEYNRQTLQYRLTALQGDPNGGDAWTALGEWIARHGILQCVGGSEFRDLGENKCIC